MNIEQTIKAQREERDKIIGKIIVDGYDKETAYMMYNYLKFHAYQSIKQILEVLVEEEQEQLEYMKDEEMYEKAKWDTINRLKEAIALLDNKEL
jgi:hypothetical protein